MFLFGVIQFSAMLGKKLWRKQHLRVFLSKLGILRRRSDQVPVPGSRAMKRTLFVNLVPTNLVTVLQGITDREEVQELTKSCSDKCSCLGTMLSPIL